MNNCNAWALLWVTLPFVVATLAAVSLAGWSGAYRERLRWLQSINRNYRVYGDEALPHILDEAEEVSHTGWSFVGHCPATKPQLRRPRAPKPQEPPCP